jgi:hypothetical protein
MRNFSGGVTQTDIGQMDEAELAALAAQGPEGFSAIMDPDGRFSFVADWAIDRMSPLRRAELTFVGRMN